MCLGICRVDERLGGRRENGNSICLWRTHERIVGHFLHVYLPNARAAAQDRASLLHIGSPSIQDRAVKNPMLALFQVGK
jgi:hypothetical protein